MTKDHRRPGAVSTVRLSLTLGILLSTSALTSAAIAQNDGGPNAGGEIDTIVVTSQFREQSVLEVPLAVTAYEGRFLEDIGVDEFDELSAFVPGFVVQEQSVNNPGFVLRGITSDDGASTIEPRVSVFQNGISISRSRGSVVPLFDLERVEVLNGPQGTLFGRSAQIGAVHIITNKADFDFSGSAAVQWGNFDQQRYQGHINIPLIPGTLAFRGAAYYETRDGFIENTSGGDLNGVGTLAVRGSILFQPIEDLRIDIVGHYVENDAPGTSFKSGVIPALGGTTNPNEFASLNTFSGLLGGRELGIDRNLYDVTVIGTWTASDAITVTSTTAYREFDSREVFDPDGTALNLLVFAEDAQGEQFSSDLRIAYDDGGPLSGFFGGGIFREEGIQSVPLGFDLSGLQLFSTFGAIPDPLSPGADVALPGFVNQQVLGALLTGNPAIFPPSGLAQTENATNLADNFSFDVFAELTYEILPNLEFTAGGRFTYDDKQSGFAAGVTEPNPTLLFLVSQSSPLPVLSVLGGQTPGVLFSDDQAGLDNTFSGFAWRGVLNYQFADDKYAYFNYSRGRRPQVIEEDFSRDGSDANGNGLIGDTVGSFVVVPAETVDSFEVGLKGNFFDDLATLQAAAYYYAYSNFQTSIAVNEPGSAPEFDLINAGTASSFGVELSAILSPTDFLDVFATYGFNRSRFDDEDSDGNPQQFAGNQFRLAPDHSFSVGLSANTQITPRIGVFFRPTFTWQSEVFFTNDNDLAFNVIDPTTNDTIFTVPSVSQEAYGLLNINAGIELFEGQFVLEGYVKNLTNKDFIIDGGNTGGVFQIPTFIAGAPRFYGAGVTFRF
ncbi:MAG: TonB-dependent receptor [Pseudomonadota bacterium]